MSSINCLCSDTIYLSALGIFTSPQAKGLPCSRYWILASHPHGFVLLAIVGMLVTQESHIAERTAPPMPYKLALKAIGYHYNTCGVVVEAYLALR